MQLFFLAIVLPAALAAPAQEKRMFISYIDGSLFDIETFKCDIQIMVDVLGSDPTEAACDTECYKLLQDGLVLNYGCPLVCHGLHTLNVTPDPNGTAPPCAATTTGRK